MNDQRPHNNQKLVGSMNRQQTKSDSNTALLKQVETMTTNKTTGILKQVEHMNKQKKRLKF